MLQLALVSRSVNTAYYAWRLIYDVAYTQAIMLVRHINEDWLMTYQVAFSEDVRDQIWDRQRVKERFIDMAAEIGKEVADWWGEAYGAESEIAHPRGASLAIQLAGANVRLGPIYDADLVLSTLYMLMLETARMASIGSHTVDLINEGKLEGAWTSKLQDLTSRVSAWKESAERRIAASGGLPIPEPPEQAAPTGQS